MSFRGHARKDLAEPNGGAPSPVGGRQRFAELAAATSVVIEADSQGRLSITAEDESGNGRGYRLAGPKFCACHPGRTIARAVLTERDKMEIRRYLEVR